MAETYYNDFSSTLDGAINDSTQTITLDDAIPAALSAGQFRILIGTEIILVTTSSGTGISACTRGAEGTSAAAHSDEDAVTVVHTAGAIDQIRADQVLTGAYADMPAAGKEGRIYLPTDGLVHIYRDTGSAWVGFGPGGLPPPSSSGWTEETASSAPTVATDAGIRHLTCTSLAGSYRTLGGGTTRIRAHLRPLWKVKGNTEFWLAGFRENATGKNVVLGIGHAGNQVPLFVVTRRTTIGASASDYFISSASDGNIPMLANLFVEFENDSGTLYWRWGTDGQNFYALHSAAEDDFFTVAPDEFTFQGVNMGISLVGYEES